MTIAELAKMMNAKEADVAAFVRCLSVWTNKGHSLEKALELHMAQMNRFVDNATKISGRREVREMIAEDLWDAFQERAA